MNKEPMLQYPKPHALSSLSTLKPQLRKRRQMAGKKGPDARATTKDILEVIEAHDSILAGKKRKLAEMNSNPKRRPSKTKERLPPSPSDSTGDTIL